MVNLINKIKNILKSFFSRNKIKRLEARGESDTIKNNLNMKTNQIENDINNETEKKEFFETYNKIKNGQYNLSELTKEQSKKIITILKSEIDLKKSKLDHDITELKILKVDNRINEKNRIFELYNAVKNEMINLSDIDKEDLLKIRRLMLEESKIQDEKLEDEIRLLQIFKKVS